MNPDLAPQADEPVRRVDEADLVAEEPAETLDRSLRRLPVAGVSRRRVAWIVGAVISVWIVAIFARQVGDASAAAGRADQIRADNDALAGQIAALEHEREVIQAPSFVQFMARGFGLGNAKDRRFALAPNAPPLPSDAPGSASVRLGEAPPPESPLDSWMSLLFGPTAR